jgi:hypothetical protein
MAGAASIVSMASPLIPASCFAEQNHFSGIVSTVAVQIQVLGAAKRDHLLDGQGERGLVQDAESSSTHNNSTAHRHRNSW